MTRTTIELLCIGFFVTVAAVWAWPIVEFLK
jgi:hypothetical protein